MNRKTFFVIYALVIVAALICILFVVPDEMFLKNKKGYEELINTVEKVEYEDIETLKTRFENSEYDYEYTIIHNNVQYNCTGQKKKDSETGRCTSPKTITYTEIDKYNKDKLKDIKFVEPKEIFKKIKDVEAIESMTNDGKSYTYKTKISEFETDIIIYTDEDTINKITITNGLMTYILKYTNSKY